MVDLLELVRSLDWAMSKIPAPRLVRRQNDQHFNEYARASKALEEAKKELGW